MDAVSYDENPCGQLLAGFGLSMPKRGLSNTRVAFRVAKPSVICGAVIELRDNK